MPRPNITTPPKNIPTMDGLVLYRADIAFNTPGVIIPGGVGIAGSPASAFGTFNYRIGRLPVGAEVLLVKARAVTVFAGATAAGVSIGTNATAYTNLLAALSIIATPAGVTLPAAGSIIDTTVENDIIAQIITTVAVCTSGLIRLVVGISAPTQ